MITKQKLTNYQLTNNNFDLLRLLFATSVFLVHAAIISQNHYFLTISNWLSSSIAVKSFFIVSGFLIFMSYENSKTNTAFFSKRIRRIYPGYLFVILMSVFIGAFFTQSTLVDYCSFTTVKYLFTNLLFLNFLQPTLPSLFTSNINTVVNGSLWTLKIEVMFYILVPFIVFGLRRYGCSVGIIFTFLLSVLYSYLMGFLADYLNNPLFVELKRQLPGQLSYFMIGAAGYYYFETFKQYAAYLLPTAIILFLLKAYLPWIIVEPIALGILVIYFATVFTNLGHFGKYGDFSYGIYILHFPIIQFILSSHLLDDSEIVFFVIVIALVLLSSILLWHYIEKPFLNKSSHYVTR